MFECECEREGGRACGRILVTKKSGMGEGDIQGQAEGCESRRDDKIKKNSGNE